MSFKAIIFDCDGVIMDSEVLACQVSVDALNKYDYPITLDDYLNRYMGKGFRHAIAEVKAETGLDIGAQITPEEKDEIRKKVFEERLEAIPYVAEVLEKLHLPFCIASGSAMDKLEHTLDIVKLKHHFKDRYFSTELVEKGKPAPDIFLYAAKKLGINPKDCLVIEDSRLGAMAGVDAGMTVYGFTGGSHMTPERIQMLKDAGAEKLFDDMRDLLKWI